MYYRKLIKFGGSSFVVSLPAEWIRKNNLGDYAKEIIRVLDEIPFGKLKELDIQL